MYMVEVISLGLDGAAWHELDRLMDRGVLPNMRQLLDGGARAPLRSVAPPVTSPAWRCSTAGKNPGKLGVFWWLTLDRESGRFATPDATSFDTADIWNYLSEAGVRSAVLNVPMTYPPDELNGVMVSGFGAPVDPIEIGEDPITYPAEFESRLREDYDWQVGVDDLTAPDGPERVYDLIDSRFELLSDMLDREFAYVHLTIFYINMLQHKFGSGPETERAWEIIDGHLGEMIDEDALLVVYSDHGHSAVERTFSVNRWLLEQGYLSIESKATDSLLTSVYEGLKSAGVSPRRVAGVARRTLPTAVYDTIVTSGYPISTRELSDRVDWAESTAVALSQGPLYINRERLDRDYDRFRDHLRDELSAVRHDGDPVFATIDPAETVYEGPYLADAPDLVLAPTEGWELYGGITTSVVEEEVTSWTSGNHPIGMLAMAGEDVADIDLPEQSLHDVMPTVLQYLGCPIPTDLDGHVIDDAFEVDLGDPETRPPLETRNRRNEDHDDLRDRLVELGYLE